jgi:renalase
MPSSVAVIGAGVAGAAAARALVEAGHLVRVFDKGRAPGGRTSTRRYDARQFDHACPMFDAQAAGFVRAVDAWVRSGACVPVEGGPPGTFTGSPAMGAIAAHLLRGLSVRCGIGSGGGGGGGVGGGGGGGGGGEVWRVSRDGPRWRLYDKQGSSFEPAFDAVVIATPPPQAAALLGFIPAIAERLRAVTMSSGWTLMAEFEGEPPALTGSPGGALSAGSSSVLQRILLDSAKRPGPARNAWVAHATEEWTREHLELEPERVEPLLLEALRDAVGDPIRDAAPTFVKAHRWRYARVVRPDPEACIWDPTRRFGVCGDGFTSTGPSPGFGTVEAAYMSGKALVDGALASLDPPPA